MAEMADPLFRTDLYRGTAGYYDRYRRSYPTALIGDLVLPHLGLPRDRLDGGEQFGPEEGGSEGAQQVTDWQCQPAGNRPAMGRFAISAGSPKAHVASRASGRM